MDLIVSKIHYWTHIVLIIIGLYGMMMKRNLLKKLVGMTIFQWSIILFYISLSGKRGGSVPIIIFESMGNSKIPITEPLMYVNPLPHVLMLTAIVVAVATTGIALALIILTNKRFGTVEEDEILEKLKER
ncbi:MAG: cation:proton antiporter subunit C [Desulfobacterota bacterium]|nr:cation:proton antiporter subunit C [Thermodesulfobacteriota bacterium]MDW8002142.1 cation:proton antiporter subunit C [Deltaproteobacteria bacterium]